VGTRSLAATPGRPTGFDLFLLDGLSGKAPKNRAGLVHLTSRHSYGEQRVEEDTRDEQHVVIDRPATIRTIPLTKP
jgi:hypothetical protein